MGGNKEGGKVMMRKCPACKSTNINFGSTHLSSKFFDEVYSCNDCDLHWNRRYPLNEYYLTDWKGTPLEIKKGGQE